MIMLLLLLLCIIIVFFFLSRLIINMLNIIDFVFLLVVRVLDFRLKEVIALFELYRYVVNSAIQVS